MPYNRRPGGESVREERTYKGGGPPYSKIARAYNNGGLP